MDSVDDVSEADVRNTWIKLKEKYGIQRPLSAKIGEDLYSMSHENGYDTKEKQLNLFNKIFNKYTILRDPIHRDKLSDIICVVPD